MCAKRVYCTLSISIGLGAAIDVYQNSGRLKVNVLSFGDWQYAINIFIIDY